MAPDASTVSGPLIAYTVRCTFSDAAVAEEWCRWMVEGHLAGVCAAGAVRAELVRLDVPATAVTATPGTHAEPKSDDARATSKSVVKSTPDAVTYEARYLFRNRDDFRRYEAESAPALRAQGLVRFPLERGLVYERTTAEVLGIAREVPIGSAKSSKASRPH
jgi:hypothetical protein